MNLDPDLLRILNPGAKVYNTQTLKQGKVYSNNQIDVIVDYSKGKYETYSIDEFAELLTSDVIVANSRVTLGNGENFKIKPREVQPDTTSIPVFPGMKKIIDREGNEIKIDGNGILQESSFKSQPAANLEVGYINFPTGKFSTEPKKGYTKVEYRRVVEKVTLELTSEQIDALREMGLLE